MINSKLTIYYIYITYLLCNEVLIDVYVLIYKKIILLSSIKNVPTLHCTVRVNDTQQSPIAKTLIEL